MEIHAGSLTVKAVSSLFRTKCYSDIWCVLYAGRSEWAAQINLYPSASDTTRHDKCLKTIALEKVQWINASESGIVGPVFGFTVKGKKFWFIASSDQECQDWIFALCCTSKGLNDSKGILGYSDSLAELPVQMDNDLVIRTNTLYSGTSEMKTFDVIADNTSACAQHNIKGHLQLCVEMGMVYLTEKNSSKKLVNWHITSFRGYGHGQHRVFFHPGSHSDTGPGMFCFITTEGENIVKTVDTEAHRLKESGSQSNLESSHVYNNEPNTRHGRQASLGKTNSEPSTGAEGVRRDRPGKKPVPPTKPKLSSTSSDNDTSSPKLVPHLKDGKFKEKLELTISHGTVEPAPLHSSVDRNSTVSSKSVDKKMKELEKERKKEEKQKKKEQEKELKRQKKLDKEEAKKQKSNVKRENSVETIVSSTTDMQQANNYSEAEEPVGLSDNRIYSDPWENKPFPSPPISPGQKGSGGGTADTYAVPMRKDTNQADDDVYDHFSATTPNESDHIYGIESASAPFNPNGNFSKPTGQAYQITNIANQLPDNSAGVYELV